MTREAADAGSGLINFFKCRWTFLQLPRYNGAYLAFPQRCTVQVLQKFGLA